jgi:hypothetical protein
MISGSNLEAGRSSLGKFQLDRQVSTASGLALLGHTGKVLMFDNEIDWVNAHPAHVLVPTAVRQLKGCESR